MRINGVGIVSFCIALGFVVATPDIDFGHGVVILVAAYALPIIILEALILKTWARSSTGLDFSRGPIRHWPRIGMKILGVYATFGLVFGFYWVFPHYDFGQRGDVSYYWNFLRDFAPLFVLLAPVYVWLIDGYLRRPRDVYWQVGALLLLRRSEVDGSEIAQHLLGWLVKAFFLLLMFSFTVDHLRGVVGINLYREPHSWLGAYKLVHSVIFLLDVIPAAAGYLLTFRIFDSHIRSTDPTAFGWMVCLMCYPPFWGTFDVEFFNYGGGGNWVTHLRDAGFLFPVWGVLMLGFESVYIWATVIFGIRFSNLTHRGIITKGPYRFTKHPAYVSKNISWWLISMPFISAAPLEAFRLCLLLLGVNAIYYFRAKTEERHLSRDPAYVAYALAMNQRSVFRPLARLLPFLVYKPNPVPLSPTMPDIDYEGTTTVARPGA